MTWLGVHWHWWMILATAVVIAFSAGVQLRTWLYHRRRYRRHDIGSVGQRLRDIEMMYDDAKWIPVNDCISMGQVGHLGSNAAAGRQTHNIPGHGKIR